MSKLTVLHLSDSHWSKKREHSKNSLVTQLLADLQTLQKRGILPDIVVFSGDLVQAGQDAGAFAAAYEKILNPILKFLNLTGDRLFVCPGNHDISREVAREQSLLNDGLSARITTPDALEDFVERAIAGAALERSALDRLSNFYQWHDSLFDGFAKAGNFCRLKVIEVSGKKIGVSLFNSAWRSSGEPDDVDNGQLILGSIFVETARSRIEHCDYKIAVFHHPTDIHAEFDRVLTEPRLSKDYDLICTGHTHRPRPVKVEDFHGASIKSQAGSIYAGTDWFNGYQVIEVDFVEDRTRVYCREFFPVTGKFDKASNLVDADPIEFKFSAKIRAEDDQVEQFLSANRHAVRSHLLDHLNFSNSEDLSDEALLAGFACPKLFKKGEGSVDESGNLVDTFSKFSLDEILMNEEGVLLYGPRQTGKTALKLYCAYRFAFGLGCKPKIPVIIDVTDFAFNRYALEKCVTRNYDVPNDFDFTSAIRDGFFVFLFEDVGELSEAGLKKLNHFVENYRPNRSFAFGCPSETSMAKERHFRKVLTGFTAVGLGELTRASIRKMTQSWFEESSEAKAKFDLVLSQINRDGLPRTAYIVGLLLWAAKQGQQGDRINEAILLQNVLDHLLGRANFEAAKRGSLTTKGKELLLNKIANCLDDIGGAARSADVIRWVDEYFGKKKLGHDASEVVAELVNCGILKRENGSIRFRYPCFQEYYIALGMIDPVELVRKADGTKFLGRSREVELLSGLQGENDWLIENICSVLTERMPRDLAEIEFSDFGAEAYEKDALFLTRDKLRKIKRTRLTEEQLDQVMDALDERAAARGDRPISETLEETGGNIAEAVEVRRADAVRKDLQEDAEFFRPGTYMAALTVLARVLRNSDYTDYDVKGPALQRLLEEWCRIHVILTREVRWILERFEEQEEEPLSTEEFETMVRIVSKILFGAVGGALVTDLATPALTETINELAAEGGLESGKRVLSLFLLEDSDDPAWPDKWNEVIENKQSAAFDIDVLIDRLWRSVNRKALDTEQDKRIIKVVNAVEARFDWENNQKSKVLEDIRGLTNVKRARED